MKIAIKQVRGISGIDVWAQNLCNGIQQAGHHCTLDLKPSVFELYPGLLSLFPQQQDVDIIHGNSWNGFAFKNGIPLVITEHLVVHDPALNPYKTESQRLYHRWIYRYERRTFDIADAIVSVSSYTKQKVEDLFGLSDSAMIYNGIDSSFFTVQKNDRAAWGIPDDKCIILNTGNLTRRKGADLLPEIMTQLGEHYLLLTTSGNRNKSHSNIPHSRDIGHLNREQLVQAYNLCDIFLIPSRMEGLSLSALEAMSCGRPVIAFNCTSFPELVVDGEGGYLCEKDNVKELVDRIRYLAEEPELIQRMGKFNRTRILENFTIERMTTDYLKLYQSLLD